VKVLRNKALFFVLLAVIFALGVFRFRSDLARDYYQFWVVGQAVKSMVLTDVYGDQDRQRIGEYFLVQARLQGASAAQIDAATYRRRINPAGTPFLYSLFSLVSTGRYDFDYDVYRIVSLAAYLLSIAVLCGLFRIPRLPAIFAVLVLTLLFGPFRLDVMEGNINQLQVGAIAFILWLQSRKRRRGTEFASGLGLGLLLMLKPNLAPLLVFFFMGSFFMSRFKTALWQIAGVTVGILFGLALPVLILGRVCTWSQWLSAFPNMVFTPNYFSRSFLGNFFGAKTMAPFLVLAGALVVLPFVIWAVRAKLFPLRSGWFGKIEKSAGAEAVFSAGHLMLGLGVCVYLLASPLVHYHYFTLVVPILLFTFRREDGESGGSSLNELKRAGVGLAVCILMGIRAQYIGDGGLPFEVEWTLAYIGVWILYGWCLLRLAGMKLDQGDRRAAGMDRSRIP
jgi:hypothetical protein